MLSDPLKLFFLAICTIGCLSTLFTSASIRMGHSSMGVMTPRNHCMAAKRAVNQCKTQSSKGPCKTLEEAASKCQKAVKQAYRHINLGGCPFEIKSLTLCEAEWCRSNSRFQDCEKECSMVRKNLDTCIENQVLNYFLKSGLEKDGTIPEKK